MSDWGDYQKKPLRLILKGRKRKTQKNTRKYNNKKRSRIKIKISVETARKDYLRGETLKQTFVLLSTFILLLS